MQHFRRAAGPAPGGARLTARLEALCRRFPGQAFVHPPHIDDHSVVGSAPDFLDGPKVMNGASDLMVTAFADKGRHARTTVGVAVLPLDAEIGRAHV